MDRKNESRGKNKNGGMEKWQEELEVTQDGMQEGWKAR